MEGDNDTFGPSIHLFDTRLLAQALDRHGLKQVLYFRGERAETIDQFDREGFNLALVDQIGKPTIEAEPDREIRDISLREQHRSAQRDLRGPFLRNR